MENEVQGYSLFNHIEDDEIRRKNRATCVINMVRSNMDGSIVSQYGMYLVMKYWSSLPEGEERGAVYSLVYSELINLKLLEV